MFTIPESVKPELNMLRVGGETDLATLNRIVRAAYEAEPGNTQENISFDDMIEVLRRPGERRLEVIARLIGDEHEKVHPSQITRLPLEFEAPIEGEGCSM